MINKLNTIGWISMHITSIYIIIQRCQKLPNMTIKNTGVYYSTNINNNEDDMGLPICRLSTNGNLGFNPGVVYVAVMYSMRALSVNYLKFL